MSLPLIVSALTLPEGICATLTSEQDRLNAYAEHLAVTFPGDITGISVSTTKPADTSKAWLRLDAFGRMIRLYWFSSGWYSLHPQFPGFSIPWTGTLPDFNTFDEGDAGAPGIASGPMWEVVTELAGKFPVGVGTLPSGAILTLGTTGGEDKHTLTIPELPAHHHTVPAKSGLDINATSNRKLLGDSAEFIETANTSDTGGGIAMPLMPPYLTINWIRRTNRLYYVVP